MMINSFVKKDNVLIPAEIEILLTTGLPQIHFLGNVDPLIKESSIRIKSAIKKQGFQFPKAQQIIVNIRAPIEKKMSRGLELAIATGILWETEQIERSSLQNLFVYGELSLEGKVLPSYDLDQTNWMNKKIYILTGENSSVCENDLLTFDELKNIDQLNVVSGQKKYQQERPQLNLSFTEQQARLIEIVSMGEHSLLLAGPSGSGKTTISDSIPYFLEELSYEDFKKTHHISKAFGHELKWRPFVKPHHSISPVSMIGGGAQIWSGEITRAHRGVLCLDELLEFQTKIQEALREPFEEGIVRVARCGQIKNLPADVLIVATTNLCPCGSFVPGRLNQSCHFSLVKCKSYYQKLSGPLVDRFQIMSFSDTWGFRRSQTAEDILAKLNSVRSWKKQYWPEKTPNSKLGMEQIKARFTDSVMALMPEYFTSERRRLALLRVALTIADLDQSKTVRQEHFKEALNFTNLTFEKLKKWDS